MQISNEQVAMIRRVSENLCRRNGITDYDAVEDVVGEGLLAAVEAADKIGEDFTDGLLVQAAQWRFFNGARSTAAEMELESLDVEEAGEYEDTYTLHDTVPDPLPGPEEILEQEQDLADLQRNLRGLLAEEQLVINTLYIQGKTQEQAAESIGITRARVRRTADRAMAKLVARMNP